MRKLMHSKKGFTLVELMIVVVIMGILVAVAVPVYGAVTKNAEKKTCDSNKRIIIENVNQFQMTGKDGSQFKWDDLASMFNGGELDTTADSTFIQLFNDGLPMCPTEEDYYNVTVSATDVSGKIVVTCDNAEHNA